MVDPADGIKTKVIFKFVKSKVEEKVKILVNIELNDTNLISAVNIKSWTRLLKENSVEASARQTGKQRETLIKGRRWKKMYTKLMRDVYKKTRLCVACYMSKSGNRWIQAAWRKEKLKVEDAIVTTAQITMEETGVTLKFEDNGIQLDGESIEQEGKPKWNRVKTVHQNATKQMRIKMYQYKEQQIDSLKDKGRNSLMVDSKFSPMENVSCHVNAGTDSGNKVLEGSSRAVEEGR